MEITVGTIHAYLVVRGDFLYIKNCVNIPFLLDFNSSLKWNTNDSITVLKKVFTKYSTTIHTPHYSYIIRKGILRRKGVILSIVLLTNG